MIQRDKNASVGWTATSGADDTLEVPWCSWQNFGVGRADVGALLDGDAEVREWVRYSAHGELSRRTRKGNLFRWKSVVTMTNLKLLRISVV